jgi:hypothetical protein
VYFSEGEEKGSDGVRRHLSQRTMSVTQSVRMPSSASGGAWRLRSDALALLKERAALLNDVLQVRVM